jgi:secreted PhoX family phosphatase
VNNLVGLDRRAFMRRGAMGAGAFWMLSLEDLAGRQAAGRSAAPSPYGPVAPRLDETTGLPLLQLPEGFRYASFAWTGDLMADGVRCPGAHDGMAVVDRQGTLGDIVLVRNHEHAGGDPYIAARPEITFSQKGAGGTTNLLFDTAAGRWKKAWSSLAGTNRNCAGGVTPWGSWLTCEEVAVPGHGWCFDVGAERGDPTPLTDMGRFSHEAVMVDPATGVVYETEDAGDASGFYRFVPNVPGSLKQGGALYMLKVRRRPNMDLGVAYPIGTRWDVEWVRIDDPAAKTRSTFQQGRIRGGARMERLEGAWWGDRVGYFISTSGGRDQRGQVFEYDPRRESLKLIYDSPAAIDCDYPDNLTVTPRGGLLLCEDSGNAASIGERLIGLTLHGRTFTFAVNNVTLPSAYNDRVPARDYRSNEFAGACYSPDGQWLFVNIQSPGITFAITGPWGNGPL